MKLRKSVILALTLGIATAATNAVAQKVADDIPPSVIPSVMNDTYGGGYDAKHDCWAYRWKDDQGDEIDYCMRVGNAHVVDGAKGKTLYLQTVSAADIRDDARYTYSQVQPGLMGSFKIRLGTSQGWTYEALDPATDYGTAGDCGCTKALFVKLSNKGDYGWLFASGGTWQGITVADYSIVAAINGRMKDVSSIPLSTEHAPDVRYEIHVKEDASAQGLFPLHVTKTVKGSKFSEFDVLFDISKSTYALPAGW